MGLRDIFGRAGGSSPADETAVPVTEALSLLASGGVVIDVRTRAEYERGHLPGARLVPINDLRSSPLEAIWGRDPLAMLDPETPDRAVIVVSASPAHAGAIAHLLRDEGFNAHTLAGGLLGWVRDGQVLIPGPPR
ncbi:hypothetical protein GCM10009785_11360 [Brooklawnia cerclae]|uniref:Adenylyltransferase/sulfurtransferase n=1 Tax=Brooklawnia cerclae TaxID=349934 RepID=A0ABX0SKU6_9ACTN|nr:rhodanese-like domain-containing protein [Brooklawnia cerclae]NIH58636.1 adenylyltransferase/sulfurtransferase [Brooklawnia cerclae]